jgi:hypothetical protein
MNQGDRLAATQSTLRPLRAAALAALAALVLALVTPVTRASASATDSSAVRLSITLTDSAASVAPHTEPTYRASLINAGSDAVSGWLVVSAPGYMPSVRANVDGKITKHDLRWKITVPAGQAVTQPVRFRVLAIPKSAVRVTVLASFYLGAVTGMPVIRTADSDRIPGVVDPAPAPAIKPPAPRHEANHQSSAITSVGWAIAGAATCVFLLLLAFVAQRRATASRPEQDRADRRDDDTPAGVGLAETVGPSRTS